jgi:hypothetical protein
MANISEEPLVEEDYIRYLVQITNLTSRVPIGRRLIDHQIIRHLRIESEVEYYLQKFVWHVFFQLPGPEPDHDCTKSIFPCLMLLIEIEVLASWSSCSSVLLNLRVGMSKVLSRASCSPMKSVKHYRSHSSRQLVT